MKIKEKNGKISAKSMHEFAEVRRAANNAVKKAIDENKKLESSKHDLPTK